MSLASTEQRSFWRAPLVILLCGCLIGLISFGPRSTFGFFLAPMDAAHGWGRDQFGLALAIEMLLWGAGQPFSGALADRFGAPLVLAAGTLLYVIGIVWMAFAQSPFELYMSAGVLIGFGLAGCSFTLVIGAFAKLLPPQWRTVAFGAGTAAGSFGQFLFSPLAVALIDNVGWQNALLTFGAILLVMLPLSFVLSSPRQAASQPGTSAPSQSVIQALVEACGHRSYVLLTLGYFTCGFQLFFITVHLPAYLVDRGLPASIGGWTLAVIGLFNIIGSVASGYIANLMPKRFLLSAIYFSRSVAILVFITLPPGSVTTLIFGAAMGLLWLSTIPPTSALVSIMFGPRWLTMLLGVSFFSHQVGGFLGVWLGGVLFERTGSYDVIWWATIFFGVASAIINLPIVERPVSRPAPAATPA
jgi:MFS family permease